MYEKSFQHRDVVDGVYSSTEADFIITTSLDGHLKFWKKNYIGIEAVKHYKAHQSKITGVSISPSGFHMATCSSKDDALKIFDILNFDMIHFMKLEFTPYLCEFLNKSNNPELILVVTEKNSGNMHIIKGESKGEILKTIKIHSFPILVMKFNVVYNTLITIDQSGMIEYSEPQTSELPSTVNFKYKAETDLYTLSQNKLTCLSLTVSPNGRFMAMMCKDKVIRIFNFLTGKIYKTYNESVKHYFENYNEIVSNDKLKIDKSDYDKRLVLEREIEKYIDVLPGLNAQFDDSNKFICYSSMLGIKIVNFHNDTVCLVLF